jgi:hypothetical protein
MNKRFHRVEQVEQRVRMLLGIVAAHEALLLEFYSAHNVDDLLVQHPDTPEQETDKKGWVQQMLATQFAKVAKVAIPLSNAA